MSITQESKTVGVKACTFCSGGLLEYDRFCRWCGERQSDSVQLPSVMKSSRFDRKKLTDSASRMLSPYTTSALERAGAKAGLYRRVSGPLVSAVVASVSANSSDLCSGFMKRAVLALFSIPIWLIIVLLSPLDAYAAAKNLLREN